MSRDWAFLCSIAVVIGCRAPVGPAKSDGSPQTDDANPQPEPAAATPPEPEFTCPTGMLLVPGGQPTDAQVKRWSTWAGREIGAIDPFCLDERPVGLAEYVECSQEAGCGRAQKSPLSTDEYKLPANLSDKRAQAYCEFRERRFPLLEEYMWAAAGGTEDRPYPWGDAPLDQTRAATFDEGDKREHVAAKESRCQSDREDMHLPNKLTPQQRKVFDDDPITDESCDEVPVAKAMRAFPWDDGASRYEAPIDAFPGSAGRWGHVDLMRRSWVVIVSDETLPRSKAFGSCGFFPAPKEDGTASTLADEEVVEAHRPHMIPPCLPGTYYYNAVRCAVDAQRVSPRRSQQSPPAE